MQHQTDNPFAQWRDAALLIVAWLIALSAFVAAAHCEPSSAQAQRRELARQDAPPLDGVEKYGYIIEQVFQARYPSSSAVEGFEGTVWVRYKDSRPEWRFTLTLRPKRAEAVRDCEAWMDRIEHALKKSGKSSG
ncbi:MAG TPA: hypothetical protein VEG64_17570 [Candidatus Sulfotelmatobacter sp.]|nr:hypothetical protein [Candidatus Sulfotelmatobacter sp.]